MGMTALPPLQLCAFMTTAHLEFNLSRCSWAVCVEHLLIKGHRAEPLSFEVKLRDSSNVRQQGGLPRRPVGAG